MSPSRMVKPSDATEIEQDLKTDNQNNDSPLRLCNSDSQCTERKQRKEKTSIIIQFGSFATNEVFLVKAFGILG